MKKKSDIKDKILEKLLEIAAFEGWNEDSLNNAASRLKIKQSAALAAFPDGISDAVDYLSEKTNAEMEKRISKTKFSKLRIRDKIATLVFTHLEIHANHKEAMRKLLGYYLHPAHSYQGLRHLSKTVSKMWYMAGDTSADFNFYTKRILLAGVFTSTAIYWLNDSSKNNENTQKFLARRIEEVMKIQKYKATARKLIDQIPFIRKVFS